MKQTTETINFEGNEITLTSKLTNTGIVPTSWGTNTLHNEFTVTVKCNGAKISFKFYGSAHDYSKNITKLAGNDLISAFECFLSDSIAVSGSFEDFCGEMGYDTDSRKAYKIFRACEKSYAKAKKLGIDLYDLSNNLRETYEL